MKIRIRFVKNGTMQYIGHLDLMRYFQKLFRRCGFDVSYSQGFNPHQLMSFASPLGLGVTTIADYLDVSLESYNVTNSAGDLLVGSTLSKDKWIERINEYSNDMVQVTGIYELKDEAKTSMSLLSAASYVVTGFDDFTVADIMKYYTQNEQIIYTKHTKKSTKEINLKDGILVLSDSLEKYGKLADLTATRDVVYESEYADFDNALYMLCLSGSDTNIKPEMLLEAYHTYKFPDSDFNKYEYDIMRTDMFYYKNGYISMSILCNDDADNTDNEKDGE